MRRRSENIGCIGKASALRYVAALPNLSCRRNTSLLTRGYAVVDPLSDVMRAVRLTGAFFYMMETSSPWGVRAAPARDLVPRILPYAEHLISYHIIVSGSCWAGVDGQPQVNLQPGDVIVFPQGDAHLMGSAPGIPAGAQFENTAPRRYPDTIRVGLEPRDTAVVCGFLGCDVRPYNPLLTSLPRLMHVSGIAGGWMSDFPQQVVAESRRGRVGSETMLTRMAELMFIEVVRRHVEQLSPQHSGWLGGLRDDVVGPALAALHKRPAHPWTLAELAGTIASSRTVLVDRFSDVIGVSPMQYLTRWRMQLAAGHLASRTAKVATIGALVGYDSEPAFSRAFKRETGVSPAAWRRAREGA